MLQKFQQKINQSDMNWVTQNIDMLNLPFEDGFTALQHAVLMNNVEISSLLIHQAGYQSLEGFSALMLAASNDNTTIIPLLLQAEAGLVDCEGKSALIYAVEKQALNSIQILIKYESNLVDRTGKSAISYTTNADIQDFLAQFEILRPTHEQFLEVFE
ncbi:Ankyrin repeat-containing protein [Spironucleus salmonicida]|uniref:Ankyrin repeat-containing protein n=1 Tax=Spironucleus salmonicida TaxID=348837 RepID=V6LLJ7_9EUKA|nr:Ankyrin repeat-containing protein [Spironucleus salmonicida]|eukprot:EST45545.1 Ankyrin repeat-containing protein [Spironucleus salmonicida]